MDAATDTDCVAATDGPGYEACIHGAEKRVNSLPGAAKCTGITASDDPGAFGWQCVAGSDAATDPARLISVGLGDTKLLSDLINFTTLFLKAGLVMLGAKLLRLPAPILRQK